MKIKHWMYINDKGQLTTATKAGINPSLFNRYLNGHEKLASKHVTQLAEALGLSEVEITSGEVRGALHLKTDSESKIPKTRRKQ